MPPKKKNKKRKPIFIGDIDIAMMTREELENFIKELKGNLKNARENRSAAQLNRDKFRVLWLVAQEETDELRKEIERRIKETGLVEEEGNTEMKLLLQEMKYWEYMTPNKLAELNAETVAKLQQFKENFDNVETEMLQEKRKLRQQITEAEISREQELTAINKHYEVEYNQLCLEIEKTEDEAFANLDIDFEKIAKREKLTERLYTFSIAERKNTMMSAMRKNHDQAFEGFKNFYMDITVNGLTLISHLKDSIVASKKKTAERKRQGKAARIARLWLTAPFRIISHSAEIKRRKQLTYEENNKTIAKLLEDHKIRDVRIKGFLWESDVLLRRITELREELDMYETYYNEIIIEAQNYTETRTEMMRENVLKLQKKDECNVAEINQAMANCPPLLRDKLDDVEGAMNRAMAEQTHTLNDLRHKLARAQKAHDQLIESFECKCKEMGVPEDCLGIETLQKTINARYKPGPAGLLTKNK